MRILQTIDDNRLARFLAPEVHLRCSSGAGANGVLDVNIMQAVDYITGGDGRTETNALTCVDPVIRGFCAKLSYSDAFAAYSDDLKPYITKLVNTNVSEEITRQRGFMCADWAVRVIAPHMFAMEYKNELTDDNMLSESTQKVFQSGARAVISAATTAANAASVAATMVASAAATTASAAAEAAQKVAEISEQAAIAVVAVAEATAVTAAAICTASIIDNDASVVNAARAANILAEAARRAAEIVATAASEAIKTTATAAIEAATTVADAVVNAAAIAAIAVANSEASSRLNDIGLHQIWVESLILLDRLIAITESPATI